MTTTALTAPEILADLTALRERLARCKVEAARDGIRARIDARLDELLLVMGETAPHVSAPT